MLHRSLAILLFFILPRLLVGVACASSSAELLANSAASADETQDALSPLEEEAAGRTGSYPIALDPTRLALAWQINIPDHAPAQPASNGSSIFIETRAALLALDATTGEVKWKLALGLDTNGAGQPPAMTVSPVYARGIVYFGTGDSLLREVDASQGVDLAEIRTDGNLSCQPVVARNSLFLGTTDGALYCYNLASPSDANITSQWSGWASPGDAITGISARDGILYAATHTGTIFALDCQTGAVRARTALAADGEVYGPVAASERVYVARGRSLVCLSAGSLRTIWTQTFTSSIGEFPAVSTSSLFLVTNDGSLYALKSADGSERWATSLGTASNHPPNLLDIGGILVVPTSSGQVFGFDAVGDGHGACRLLWQYAVPGKTKHAEFLIPPGIQSVTTAAAAGMYVLAEDGTLTRLSTDAVDLEGPTIDMLYPREGRYAPTDASRISACIQDRGSGYLRGSLKFSLDGVPITSGYVFDPSSGAFSYTARTPLGDGVHIAEIIAADNRHNQNSAKWAFSVDHTIQTAAAGSPTAITPDALPAGALSVTSGNPQTARIPENTHFLSKKPAGLAVFAPNYLYDLRHMTHWARFPVVVAFVRDVNYTAEREQAARAGFDRWSEATNSIISYRVAPSPSSASITVRFDPHKADGQTSTESSNSKLVSANIALGVSLPGDAGLMPMVDLECVAAHEFGHALGINGHSTDPGDLMYFQHTVGQIWSLSERDLNTLKTNYNWLFAGTP